jgi:hypothetical protein
VEVAHGEKVQRFSEIFLLSNNLYGDIDRGGLVVFSLVSPKHTAPMPEIRISASTSDSFFHLNCRPPTAH